MNCTSDIEEFVDGDAIRGLAVKGTTRVER